LIGRQLSFVRKLRPKVIHQIGSSYAGHAFGALAGLLIGTFVLTNRDRFYKTPFRPKTFRMILHPSILDKFLSKKSRQMFIWTNYHPKTIGKCASNNFGLKSINNFTILIFIRKFRPKRFHKIDHRKVEDWEVIFQWIAFAIYGLLVLTFGSPKTKFIRM
jgi:hypothetical protein